MPDAYSTVCVSGGFDPIHKGHVRMIQEASQFGDVIVIVSGCDTPSAEFVTVILNVYVVVGNKL
jgi:cytidyltransferase-like protein